MTLLEQMLELTTADGSTWDVNKIEAADNDLRNRLLWMLVEAGMTFPLAFITPETDVSELIRRGYIFVGRNGGRVWLCGTYYPHMAGYHNTPGYVNEAPEAAFRVEESNTSAMGLQDVRIAPHALPATYVVVRGGCVTTVFSAGLGGPRSYVVLDADVCRRDERAAARFDRFLAGLVFLPFISKPQTYHD